MNDPKENEVTEELEAVEETPEIEEPEVIDEPEPEITDEELIGAIDEELTDDSEETPDGADEVSDQETETDDEPEKPEPEPEPEPKAEDAKPSDEFGTLEEGTPEKTRERFETMKGRFDEIVQERDEIKAEADTWKQTILETGTNPEQFGMALTWLGKVNSGKPDDLQEAYTIMANELNAIGKMIGKPALDGASPLDDHPDLKQRVDDGMLDEKDALELVEARATKNLNATHAQTVSAEQEREQKVNGALKEIEQLGHDLGKSDPLFKQKMNLLAPMVDGIIKSAPNAPETWKAAIMAAYERIPVMQNTPKPPKPATPESIRPTPTSPSSVAMDKEPGSEMEAIDLALSRGY